MNSLLINEGVDKKEYSLFGVIFFQSGYSGSKCVTVELSMIGSELE